MHTYEALYRALANIYVAVEEVSPRKDVLDSRPRQVPQEFKEIYIELIGFLEEIHEVKEGRIYTGTRKQIQKRLPYSKSFLGYEDEELDLTQMVSRQIGWGKR
tara:strand:+ start:2563 stop:2871 length:309 start_codon:yes stop_codon:yes gene_type:complete